MSRKLIAAFIAVLIGLPAVYIVSSFLYISNTQSDIGNIGKEPSNIECRTVKEGECSTGGILESDYPDSCFEEGEHVLDDPYQCSN